MCLRERNTTSRGRSVVPETFLRTRRCRRYRRPSRVLGVWIARMLLRSRLARFAADPFALVSDTLALVGLGRPDRPELGGDLTYQLFVRARDLHHGVVLDLKLDAGRRG